jgi:FkbM family methyltransferase
MPFDIGKAKRKATNLAKKYIVGTALETPVKTLYDTIHSRRPDKIQTEILEVINQSIGATSNCVDIGCHKGFFLRHILRLSPKGYHFAFEPIPRLYRNLERHFSSDRVRVLPYALSSSAGSAKFHFNRDNPAFSGLRRRLYPSENDRISILEVDVRTLDGIIPSGIPIDLIKIDVEGAELLVLRGASETIERSHPVIIFEFGTGSSEYYGTTPDDIYAFLAKYGYGLFTLSGFLSRSEKLSSDDFKKMYVENVYYDFVALPNLRSL